MRAAWQNLLLILLTLTVPAFAAEPPCAPVIAELVSAQGSIEIRRLGQAKWQPAGLGDTLCAGDRVRVKERSRAALAMTNEIVMRLDEQTTVTLLGVEAAQPSLLELCRGAMHFFTRYRKTFRVITPFVNAAVEGTELSIDHLESHDNISVYEGEVRATNEPTRLLPETCEDLPKPAPIGGSLILTSGESGFLPVNQAPSKLALVARPEDAVQWALYYPPIVDYGFGEELGAPGTALRESIELYRQGRIPEAISRLDKVPESARDPRFLTYRAGLLLFVGRVDEARPDIEQALKLDPGNSNAYALKAIISFVRNQKGEALALATKAIELDEKSSAARIALSYAQQANFQIEQALESVKEAVALDPKNALAWARLAELEMSTGNLDRALEAAQRAVTLNPNLARTHMVLGFAHLTRIDTQAAKTSFTRAIELDQADPLPRLGLGLARIRESNLEEGRREIEIATSLDPSSSLTRSYLGKAYYEEKREDLAGTQFELAKALDPRDPTSWFYDAIRKQTENRPVEALQDLEKSIELNDNRAVYRSTLLLDQDRATRGTSLARIYDDLGFDQLALVEASNSLSLDPTNHSAHRFLSDAYARIPRHEIARVSELLQAQLLQPLNVNPVQPRLAVTDLNIVAGAGPAEAAFNEFHPLFERNRPQFTLSGVAGNNDTWGDEAVLSGLAGKFSYSLGQFHYETNGFRKNNDLRHDIYDAFAQYAATPNFNVQAEFRTRETIHGDITLNFDPDNFSSRDRRHIQRDTARLGLHGSISPQSDVIASLIHQDETVSQDLFFSASRIREVEERFDQRGYLAEAQYLFRASDQNLVAGLGSYRIRLVPGRTVFFTTGRIVEEPRTRFFIEQQNAYTYVNIEYPRLFIWTLGLSYDSFSDSQDKRSLREWSPKLGLQWHPRADFQIRLAAFETLKRALIAGQTIEPTQIAGFNQFFDDVNATRARRYGLGVDWRLSEKIYAGIEGSERDLDHPRTVAGRLVIEDRREKAYRGYVSWILDRDWVIGAEYQYENFDRSPAARDNIPVLVRTIHIPLSVRYFRPNGVFAQVAASHVRQTVDRTATLIGFGEGEETFTVLDAAVGYRDRKRRFIVSLEARNLTGEKFAFQDDNFRTPEIRSSPLIPARTLFLRFTLSF